MSESSSSAIASSATRDQLILDHQHLVHTAINTLKCAIPDGYTRDDLVQEGTIGLIEAIDSFDPSRGASLPTWATRCIKHTLLTCIRVAAKTVEIVPLDLCELSLPSTSDDTGTADVRINFDLARVSESGRAILELRFVEGLSKADIARRLNISPTHAARLIVSALTELTPAVT